jgi:PTS system ascorbate-specific IIA component
MTRIVLLAHAPLATALRDVAAHAFPECAAGLQAIDVQPGQSADEVEALLNSHLPADPGEDALILVDVFGATPCNAAQRVADGVRVRLVAGVNVPMLWRTLCYRQETLAALVERATAGALQGVMHVAPARRQNQSPSASGAHDQVQHSHQQ